MSSSSGGGMPERPSRLESDSKRSRDDNEDRPCREQQRGYPTQDRNMRRRVDDMHYRGDVRFGRGYRGEERPRSSSESYERGYYGEERPYFSGGFNGRGYHDEERPRSSDGRVWKCMECGIHNYDTDQRCHRCGERPRKQPRSESQDGIKVNPKQGTEKWPPPFDTDGAAYVFDAVSGMFYEAMADFFYDPKTKLYYGNKQKVYYTFQPGEDPPFSALAPSEGIEVAALGESNGPKPEAKKKIAITLKTTVLPGESDSTTRELTKNPKDAKKAKSAPPTNRPPKQHTVNMEKWSERGKEIREGSEAPTKDPPTTTKGQPVCLLCRRKFASVEKLKQHEELSALHKENLQKEKEGDAKKEQEAMASMEYRDRALERRIMHGPDTASLPALPRDLDAPAVREADVVRPEDNLGASNVGNQMLQKMGWKSGASLGRNAGSGVSSAEEGQLVKDWEKIESLAASCRHTQMKTNARKGGVGSGL